MGDVNIDIDFPKSIFVDSGKDIINDEEISSNKTWSSQKISEFISDDSPLTNNNDYVIIERVIEPNTESITIDDDRIKSTSKVELFSNISDVRLKKCIISEGAMKLVFVPSDIEIEVKIKITNWHPFKDVIVSHENQDGVVSTGVTCHPIIIDLYVANNNSVAYTISGDVSATVKNRRV